MTGQAGALFSVFLSSSLARFGVGECVRSAFRKGGDEAIVNKKVHELESKRVERERFEFDLVDRFWL
jgi:hypothetical protein